MRQKRILSFILSFIMLVACFPSNFAFAQGEIETSAVKERNVYLHAGERDINSSLSSSKMYINETGNIYFAVDNPNKSVFNAETGVPTNPDYCMNGYTVKIYYNPHYFDFAGKTSSPLVVDIPDDHFPNGQRPTDNDENFGKKGYRIQASGFEENCITIDGESYTGAYVTVFFQGFYLPQKDWEGWYDLCALPLTPKTKGTTSVYINIYQQDDNKLELFAKNISDKQEDQTFDYNLINNGMHTIEIVEKGIPSPPVANPSSGRYTSAQEVELTAESGCMIMWKDSTMTDFEEYTEKIKVSSSTTIECYAKRGDKQSSVKSYKYNIVPEMPRVFIDGDNGKELLENSVYNTPEDIYNVYASDTDNFEALMGDDVDIFYTFNEAISSDIIGSGNGGNDSQAEWVKLDRKTKAIPITKSCTLRLITRKTNTLTHEVEFSDIKICNLGIRPAKVVSSHESKTYNEKIDVTLSCATTGATIYYTLNGKNPLTDGYEYLGEPITISTNTTLRAAAKFDNQDGEVSSYFYMFNINDDYGVEAFYPPAVYEGSVTVTLTANNPENSIKYHYDGETAFRDYNGETLTITDNTTIYAKAGKENDWEKHRSSNMK